MNTIENDCNAKVSGIENKIPSITSLATTAAFMRWKIRYPMLVI